MGGGPMVHVVTTMMVITMMVAVVPFTCRAIIRDDNRRHLSPVVLVPGAGGNQLEARLTAEYKGTSWLCNRFYPIKKKEGGWFRLWFDISVLLGPFTECFADRMMLYYDPEVDDYKNTPGVETRVSEFGSTQSLLYLDPNLNDENDEYGNEIDDEDMNEEDPDMETESMNVEETCSGTSHSIYASPGGSEYWIPRVDETLRIRLGTEYNTVEEAEEAYTKYATASGFLVRKSNAKKNPKNIISNRYMVCSKEGMPAKKDYNSIKPKYGVHKHRYSNIKRVGCKAEMKIKLIKGTTRYIVYKFEEKHNHRLLDKHEMKLSRPKRQLQYTDFRKVYNAASASIGPSNTHRIETALKGGYEFMDATTVDYKNARRDMGKFVGNKDAQMLVDLLQKRMQKVPDFFFEYLTVERELQAIFWVDEIARLNYKEFGDTVSFDATYRMNQYAMVFIPFIAVDNHKKSVVVGSALVKKENIPNFTWVLQAFIKAHGKQPKFVITDQCAAMKQAIPAVFTESKHRLCMWHITKKVPNKISVSKDTNISFKRKFDKLVWNTHISPEVFEEQWQSIIDEYELHNHDWLKELYAIRESWIPAYYIDDPMSGLMKTTSRSESSHSYFRIYAHYGNDLVKFLHAYDCAIERQRNKHRCLEYVTRNSLPRCLTPLAIERHASETFTRTVFFEIQKEIRKGLYYCAVEQIGINGSTKNYIVAHKTKNLITKRKYTVMLDMNDNTLTCECNYFVRNGIVCRHMLNVLLNNGAKTIPENLVCRRWTRDLVPVEIQAARARYGEVDVEKESLINSIYTKVDLLISRMRNDKTKLTALAEILEKMKIEFNVNEFTGSSSVDRMDALIECYGTEPPESIEIIPPSGIRNKGCGRGKRLKGTREIVAKKYSKAKRMCKKCLKMGHHDSRNCPTV